MRIHRVLQDLTSPLTSNPLRERLLRKESKLRATVDDAAAALSLTSRLRRWHVMSHSALEACAALHTSLIDRCWSICCATSEDRHGKRAWELTAEHILVAGLRVHTVKVTYLEVSWVLPEQNVV